MFSLENWGYVRSGEYEVYLWYEMNELSAAENIYVNELVFVRGLMG